MCRRDAHAARRARAVRERTLDVAAAAAILPRRVLAVGYILLCLIWGSTWLAIKVGLDAGMPPLLGAAVRFAIAAALLLPVAAWTQPRSFRDRTAWRLALTVGLLSFGVGYGCTYIAGTRIPSGLGSLTFGFYPFWVAVLAHYLLGDRLTPRKAVAIALGIGGLALLYSGSLRELGASTMVGVAIQTFSVLIQGPAQILIKRDGKDVPAVFLTGVGMLIGALTLALLAGFTGEYGRDFPLTSPVVLSILYLALMGSVTTFLIYYALLKRLSATLMALVALITPPIAVGLGLVYRSERLGALTLTGGLLVLLGVATFQLEERRTARARRLAV